MFAIFEAQASLAYELEKELVYDAGGLQNIFRTFSAEERACDLSQLWINDLKEAVDGVGFSFAPLVKKLCNVSSLGQSRGSFPGGTCPDREPLSVPITAESTLILVQAS
jgi:hypothetical protein